MSRTPAAHTVALRDQLAAALRESDVPLMTPQLAELSGLAWVEYSCLGLCATVHAYAERIGHRIVGCRGDGAHRLTAPPTATAVYPHLRALEREGVIARVRYPNRESIRQATLNGTLHQHLIEHGGSRCVHWQYVCTASDDAFAALAAALEDQ